MSLVHISLSSNNLSPLANLDLKFNIYIKHIRGVHVQLKIFQHFVSSTRTSDAQVMCLRIWNRALRQYIHRFIILVTFLCQQLLYYLR